MIPGKAFGLLETNACAGAIAAAATAAGRTTDPPGPKVTDRPPEKAAKSARSYSYTTASRCQHITLRAHIPCVHTFLGPSCENRRRDDTRFAEY